MAAGRHHMLPLSSSRSRINPSSSSYPADRDGARDREHSYRERDHERDYSRDSYYYKEKERERDRDRDRERDRTRDREGDRHRDRDRERDKIRDREREAERAERPERAGKSVRPPSWYEEAEVSRRVSPLQRPNTSAGNKAAAFPESPSSNDTSGNSGGTNSGHVHHKSSGRHSAKDVEKEPGELSSGSRSEEGGEGAVAGQRSRSPRSWHQQSVDWDGGKAGSDSPAPKKRKYSPIVWDLDEKPSHSKSAGLAPGATSSKASPPKSRQTLSAASSSPSGAMPSLTPSPSLAQPALPSPPKRHTPPQSSLVHGTPPSASGLKSTPPNNAVGVRITPLLASSSPAIRNTPPSSSGGKLLPVHRSPSVSPPSPFDRVTNNVATPSPPSPIPSQRSPYVAESSVERDQNNLHLPHQPGNTPLSEDEPEPGQLPDSPRLEDPEESVPRINIAASRWAEEIASPQEAAINSPKTKNQRSLSAESDGIHYSPEQGTSQQDSGHSMSPEPGEYIRDKREGLGSGGSAGKESERDAGLDEQYDRELNERELMELDEDVHDDGEEERPEPESDEDEPASAPIPLPQRAIDMLQGCRSVDEFERLNKIDEGTYGVVYRARNKKTGEIVALKKVKMEKEREGFPMTSLREINVLLSFHHTSIVDVKEVVVGSNLDSIYMVMEYMEHDLKGLMETMKQPFSQSEVKCLMLQLLEGIKYLHDNWVLHRDLKTSNLLLNNRGELKICDFGLARQYGSPLKTYTHMVVTLWYRAPELLLGTKQYSTAIDMWSAGCIMAEFLAKEPLFNGKSELDQLDKIFKTLGTPSEKIWPDFVNLPGVKCNFVRQPFNRLREKFPATAFAGRPTLSESGFDLLNRLLTYDPKKRITAEEALKHEWFREVPLPKMKEMMPTFPARSEHDRRIRRLMKSPDPLEEQRKREQRQSELGGGGLFG